MMLKISGLLLVPVGVAALISGCTWTGSVFTSDKIEYQTAKTRTAPLEVPPDLSQLPRDERFTVPDRPQSVTASQAAARGGASSSGVGAAVVPSGAIAKIERQGSQRWLAVKLPPEKAWPVLVEFWPSVGLKVEKSDPAAGVLETNWAENRAKLPQDIIRSTLGRALDTLYSTGEQDKYRARLERGPDNTSEIFITHRGMIEVYTSAQADRTMWQPRPADPELEAEMLQRLLTRYDASAAPKPVTVAATGPTAGGTTAAGAAAPAGAVAPQKARLIKGADGRNERVEVDEGIDRAWRQIGVALDRGGFTVEDRDRSKGSYFVRYLDPEVEAKLRADQGWLDKLFSREKPIPAPQYRVQVESQGPTKTSVQVYDKDGKPDRSSAADRILALLTEQLR